MGIKNQFRSIIEWEAPQPYELFYKWHHATDELKNASKLILQPGQGCIFTYEGKIEGIFEEEGLYEIKTSNKPFITTLKKFMNFFESEHKVGLWFYRTAEINNIRWGTRMPIKYNDPVYGFPVALMGYGNFSVKITNPVYFFTNIIAGKECYFASELQELILSRIAQPIGNYLANAKFSYAEVDSNLTAIANTAKTETESIFNDLGFHLHDFRIEGSSFDKATQERIGEISNIQADALGAKLAGIDYTELQKLKAMRDAAKNEGTAGNSFGLLAGMEMAKMGMQSNSEQTSRQEQNTSPKENIKERLKELKSLFEENLITEDEFSTKKKELLDKM